MLRATAIAVGLLACAPAAASAQALSPSAKIGQALVNQHCGVCHTRPTLVAAQFGPPLDKTLFQSSSRADIAKFIADGAPDMPGFAYTLSPKQIDAILDYLRAKQPAPPSKFHAPHAAAAPAAGDN
jgi:mono/diheme cytochrome c family protein